MCDLEDVKTMVLDSIDSNLISVKLAAVNNEVRFAILEVLRDFQKKNQVSPRLFKNDPLYSREINAVLLENYNIDITPQMLGQHLKQLMNADLIEELIIKKIQILQHFIFTDPIHVFNIRQDFFWTGYFIHIFYALQQCTFSICHTDPRTVFYVFDSLCKFRMHIVICITIKLETLKWRLGSNVNLKKDLVSNAIVFHCRMV